MREVRSIISARQLLPSFMREVRDPCRAGHGFLLADVLPRLILPLLLLLSCAARVPAWAQETVIRRKPLSGQISVTERANPLRLSRSELMGADPAGKSGSEPLPGAASFNNEGTPRRAEWPARFARQAAKMDQRVPYAGQGAENQFDLGAYAAARREPPYIWAQSRDGGYYDASGTYKDGVVPGDKLRFFGGKFTDGTPVPMDGVTTNASGHVFWQNGLTHPYFWHRAN